jgi:hypothetical protein
MTKEKRKTLLVLLVVGLIYFVVFVPANMRGVDSASNTSLVGDEIVTYPNVIRMLTPGKDFYETRAHLFLYEDYHYGYPFYALSALVLLPVRIISGDGFAQQGMINHLLLRQMISVLPMILAAGILVFLQTHFEPVWKSVALFVLLLTIRGVVRNNLWWWHPDALAVLCVVLTIFFLVRDRLHFGRNFYLAAAACGLAVGIKLTGLFFFLTIPAIVIAGWRKGYLSPVKAVLVSSLFVVVMSAVMILVNPFLFSSEQRERMVMIQEQKREELSTGYTHDDPLYYSKGPQWWASTLEKWYAPPIFLFFLAASLGIGCFFGPNLFLNRVIMSFVVPYSIYMLYFVAPKPDHYWLPVMLPLFSAAFTFVDLLSHKWQGAAIFSWQKAALAAVTLLLVVQFVTHLSWNVSGNVNWYISLIRETVTN